MINIENLYFYYEAVEVLRDVSLSVNEGEILCLLGPSGCGKTTLLRVIAGLEADYRGRVSSNGQDICDIPVHKRDFGLMFQDFALFPHMTVEQNVAYGLKRRKIPKAEIYHRVQEMLVSVGLSGFENRDVNLLSGGQKQRVSLARSLAPNPKLLMLDEPLGSLDALLREQLVVELREIIKSVGLTAIYVTHDQQEAYAIADRIAVMKSGCFEQIDTPLELYFKPETEFVARFLGLSNIFSINKGGIIDDLITSSSHDFLNAESILIHPAGIHMASHENVPCFEVKAQIKQVLFRGEYFQVTLKISGDLLMNTSVKQINHHIGDFVDIGISPNFVFPLR